MSPTYTVKNGRRYRYYVSRSLIRDAGNGSEHGLRIPAHRIEMLVVDAAARLLADQAQLYDRLALDRLPPRRAQTVLTKARKLAAQILGRQDGGASLIIRTLLDRVVVTAESISAAISNAGLARSLDLDPLTGTGNERSFDNLQLTMPVQLKRVGGEVKLILGDDQLQEHQRSPDPAMVKALQRAHRWFAMIKSGEASGTAAIADHEGLTRSYVTRVMRLAFLAPDIVDAILEGRQPSNLNAQRLMHTSRLPLSWQDQRRKLGFLSR